MAGTKSLLVSKGRGAPVPMTHAELARMMQSLTPAQRREVYIRKAEIPAIVKDSNKNLIRQNISPEEMRARFDRGEQPLELPADPRLDIIRRSDKAAATKAYAGEENVLLAINKVTPYIGQKLQNLAVGPEQAAKARMEIKQANPLMNIGMDVAMLAALGTGAGAVAAEFAPGLAAGFATTQGIRGFANLMGAGAAADSYLYGQYLWDTNTPFKIEDYTRTVLTGALINAPIAGAAAIRGAVIRGAGKLIEGAGNAPEVAKNFFVAKGLMLPGYRSEFRHAALIGLASRTAKKLGRRLQGKSMVHFDDPVVLAEKAASQQQRAIAALTPQKLAKMTREERAALVDQVRGWADVPDSLGTINYETLPEKLNKAQKSADNLYREVDRINTNTTDWTYGIGGKGSAKQKGAYVSSMEEMLGTLEQAGWSDVSGDLRNLLRFDKEGKLAVNPHENFGRLVQARLDAKLKAGSLGGAAEAEKALGKVIENTDIWGTGKAPKLSKDLNGAIDELADAQKNLRKLRDAKRNLHDINAGDAALVENVHAELARIQRAYEVLRDSKMLSDSSVKRMKGLVKKTADELTDSLPAYHGAAKINALRAKAAGTTTERLARIHSAAPDFEARMKASAAEEANKLVGAHNDLLKAVQKGSDIVAGTAIGGVVFLRQLSREEKDSLFDHLQDQLPALTGSPEMMQDRLAPYLDQTSAYDPQVTGLAGVQAARTMYYLASKMPPKLPSMNRVTTPRLQREAFLQTYAAIMDPVSVLYAAAEGRATPNMLEALRVTQPAMYAELGTIASDALAQATTKAKRNVLNGLNAFVGGLNPMYRGEALMRLQQNWSQNAQQDQAINGPAQPMQRQFQTPGPTDRGNDFTFTQRLASY